MIDYTKAQLVALNLGCFRFPKMLNIKQVIQHGQQPFTSSVAERSTNNCHFSRDEMNQTEKQQRHPWLNIYIKNITVG